MKHMNKEHIREVLTRYIFPIILLVYPLRHIHWGLDLMDTGYNYSNFLFMGTDHMDPMWMFSTYLANAVGAGLTRLPFADTLIGMNFYTGLVVSLLALLGYRFCIRKLKISAGLVFLGEFWAICFCWCPTAKLYDYLTFVLFLCGCIFLYLGLSEDKNSYLAAAGVCLGANVFMRFSNLPQMAMILAVWAYAVICKDSLKKTVSRTGWCMLGYFGALLAGLLYLSIRYGFGEYVKGILQLLGMTETATDYAATSMVKKMLLSYVDMIYWIVRAVFFGVVAVVVTSLIWLFPDKMLGRDFLKIKKWISYLVSAAMACAALYWLYANQFCSVRFNEYNAMLRPGIVFLILAMFIGVVVIFHPKRTKDEKLISGIVILVILLTSLGSNNGLFPSINNLFLASPYVLWMVYRFCRASSVLWQMKRKKCCLQISAVPAKALVLAFLFMTFFQAVGFSNGFVFVEGAGASSVEAQVSNNQVLKGIKMSPDRAKWLEEISSYAAENGLEGQEVLLYGQIPSVSYYLNMPPAFNSWSDLKSYRLNAMEEDMMILEEEVASGEPAPVVILEQKYADLQKKAEEDPKFALIVEFMEEHGYRQTFCNEKFAIYEEPKQ